MANFDSIVAGSSLGICIQEIVLDDQGKPVDFRMLYANAAFERMTGLDRNAVIGKRITEANPRIAEDDFDWIGTYGAVALGGGEIEFKRFYPHLNRWFRIHAFSTETRRFVTEFTDISSQKLAEEARRQKTTALGERIKELRLLARVADLIQDKGIGLPELLEKTVDMLPEAMQWPERSQARIRFMGSSYSTPGFRTSPSMIAETIHAFGELVGVIELSIPDWTDPSGNPPFLPEEENLLLTLARYLSSLVEREKSHSALKESEAKLRGYIDRAPEAIFIVDAEGRYVEINPAATILLGYGPDELVGKAIPDILAPEDLKAGIASFATLKALGESTLEIQLRRKDGTKIWVSLEARALGNDHYMAFCKDISGRKLAEERGALLLRAIESIDQAFLVTDAEGTILEINHAFSRLYGFNRDEIVGRNPRLLNPGKTVYESLGYSPEDYDELFAGLWKSVLEIGTWEGMVVNRCKDGSLIWAKLLVNAVKDAQGRIHNLIGLPVDVSELKRREGLDKVELYGTIAELAALKDNETGNHMRRVGIYARLLAKALRMPDKYCEDIAIFAPMHDIGKVGIMDSILLAERKLNPEEWAEMKKHTTLGYNIVKGKKELDMVAAITRYHHERFDGEGYLEGLSGEDIPLSARITAVADVYDALRSERPYKRPWTHTEAVAEIKALSGQAFDPRIVEHFLALESTFRTLFDELS